MSNEDSAQLLFDRIADDERLRGDLDDEAYGHLLGWCAARATELSASIGEPGLDALTDAFRSTMRALVAASTSGDPTALEAIPSSMVNASTRRRAAAALSAAAPWPAARSRSLAESLTVEPR